MQTNQIQIRWRQQRLHWLLGLMCISGGLVNAVELPTLVFNAAANPPMNTPKQEGFLDELARDLFARIGYSIEIVHLPAERALRSANAGSIDGEILRVEGIERMYPNLVRIPEQVIEMSFHAFSKQPFDLGHGWNSLAHKDVAIINGWKILEKNVPKSATLIKADNVQQLFALLQKDRTSIVLYEGWGGWQMLRSLKDPRIKIRHPPLATTPMFMYLHNKHQALVPRLARALADMKQDGSYERLVAKHLTPLIKQHKP